MKKMGILKIGVKPRNFVAKFATRTGAGVHQKTNKAIRRKMKVEVKREFS